MPVSLRKNDDKSPQVPQQKEPRKDIYEIAVRMLLGFLMNYLTRRLRLRSELARERKQAARRADKLRRKGKEVPPELEEKSVAGLSRARRKKIARARDKAAGQDAAGAKARKSKKAGRSKKARKRSRLAWLLLFVAVIAIAVKAAGKK